MRSYRQFCAVAKALDVIGDRWSLLIARELLVRGACRYTDLLYGLPGIATNLLTDRLRQLEDAGVVVRIQTPPATSSFRLTRRGEGLRPVIHAIGAWGGPLLADARDNDSFRSHWLAVPAEANLVDHTPDRPPVTIEVRTGDQPLLIETVDGTARLRPGSTAEPDAILSGPRDVIVGVITGRLGLAAARARGAHYEGDPRVLRRVQPLQRNQ